MTKNTASAYHIKASLMVVIRMRVMFLPLGSVCYIVTYTLAYHIKASLVVNERFITLVTRNFQI